MKWGVVGVLVLFLSAGCASERTFGERMGVAVDAMANCSGTTGGAVFAFLAGLIAPDAIESSMSRSSYSNSQSPATANYIREDAYGLGVHQDQYGRPVRYQVINDPGADTSLVRAHPNAYGMGVHADQYGRPIRAVPYR